MRGIFSTLFRYREKASPDKLGLFPEAVDIPAMPERRYLWTSRILVICSALSICLTMVLALTIFLLLPQRGAKPRLLVQNDWFNQLEDAQPATKNVDTMRLVTEEHIEKYIKLRHEIPESQVDLYSIWLAQSAFYWYSTPSVYQDFAAKATMAQINQFIMDEITRKVEVEWIRPLTNNIWAAQFHTITTFPEISAPQVIIWRAYLRINYEDVPADNEEYRDNNPFGFRVIRYSLAFVGQPEKADSYLRAAKRARNQKAD